MLTTGKTSRLCTDVILYDERGPLITNYTNGNEYTFDTIRPISTKAVDTPDWGNQNGFIIQERYTLRAQCEKQNVYLLFIHIDNVARYAREMIEYWSLYSVDPGTIICEFSLEGCKFARLIGNPRIKAAAEWVDSVADQYDEYRSPLRSGYSARHNIREAISYCEEVIASLKFYQELIAEIKETCGIIELIAENGANKRIGRNDYYDITHEFDLA